MPLVQWIRNYLHNQTSFNDRKLTLLEGWLERYYPYFHRQIMTISYHNTQGRYPEYRLDLSLPINARRFAEIVSEESWVEYTMKEIDGEQYITITNTQRLEQNPNLNPEDAVLGTFKHGQQSIVFDPIVDTRGIHVSKQDDDRLDALELFFKYR